MVGFSTKPSRHTGSIVGSSGVGVSSTGGSSSVGGVTASPGLWSSGVLPLVLLSSKYIILVSLLV